ncbi:hypothetical protein HBH90_005290 [Parastagonospora nodorum]|nr:hypothetical protein HBH52_074740 [Parastagonospora nodorum]KAH4477157.1 hypothetical protein HBH90_005290 [Parastagonospora nodorum]KAH5278643.1 hypothetical protein HBI71_020580 [Parastagonospora nodorum]KAH6207128.1 hypothetical protein HBI53_128430 [Parastagonospora nodorum]
MARNRWKPGTMDERPFVHEMKTTANDGLHFPPHMYLPPAKIIGLNTFQLETHLRTIGASLRDDSKGACFRCGVAPEDHGPELCICMICNDQEVHPNRVCPRMYCSRQFWKRFIVVGSDPKKRSSRYIPSGVQLKPSPPEQRILSSLGYTEFDCFPHELDNVVVTIPQNCQIETPHCLSNAAPVQPQQPDRGSSRDDHRGRTRSKSPSDRSHFQGPHNRSDRSDSRDSRSRSRSRNRSPIRHRRSPDRSQSHRRRHRRDRSDSPVRSRRSPDRSPSYRQRSPDRSQSHRRRHRRDRSDSPVRSRRSPDRSRSYRRHRRDRSDSPVRSRRSHDRNQSYRQRSHDRSRHYRLDSSEAEYNRQKDRERQLLARIAELERQGTMPRGHSLLSRMTWD